MQLICCQFWLHIHVYTLEHHNTSPDYYTPILPKDIKVEAVYERMQWPSLKSQSHDSKSFYAPPIDLKYFTITLRL